jgi:hypothetical protein
VHHFPWVIIILAYIYISGYVKVYIILPSTIYGIATGELVDRGVQNPHSVQVPALIHAALDRGRAGMVGKGKNLWPNVHIDEGEDDGYYLGAAY